MFRRVDLPTPDEPNRQYVLPFNISLLKLSNPFFDELLIATILTCLTLFCTLEINSDSSISLIKSILLRIIIGITSDVLQIAKYLSILFRLKSLSTACTINA